MSGSEAIIYVVEDDRAFRKSILRLLRTAGFHPLAFDTASSFLSLETVQHPSCLLLDVCLPDGNGMELLERFAEAGMSIPVIFMTGHGDIPMSVKAMKEGAVDFLPKPFKPNELFRAIHEALSRDTEELLMESKRQEALSRIEMLTPRELEIMRWVITGMLNKQIAGELNISEKTVKVHRGRVMEKTRTTSVAELVRLAALVNISPAR
jgi:FixJ family two-component response regulator